MPDLSQYKKLVLKNYDKLTKNQKKIAQFLIDHPEEIAFSSIDIIASKMKVGKATVVRLAQSLGYKGFLELKAELSNRLRDDISPSKKLRAALKNAHLKSDFLTTIANGEIENIQATLDSLDQTAFDKAVNILVSASNIYTMGLGVSSFLAQIAAYYLNKISTKAKPLTHGSVSFREQIISIDKDDVIIAISLQPYSYETIEAAEFAKINGIRVISLTDQLVSPITQFSDVIFTVKTESIVFINAVSSILVIIYALATGIGLSDRKASMKALSLLEKASSDFEIDVHKEFFKRSI